MSEARSFYGGDTPIASGRGGDISGGRYEGPEAHIEAPWKCPACAKENEGRLALGCVHCGSGKPGVHVGVQRPPIVVKQETAPLGAQQSANLLPLTMIDRQFQIWGDGEPPHDTDAWEIARRAFEAGWRFGAQHQAHQQATLVHAPPVTADVDTLAPAGKPRRTIVAALEIFRDQILPQAEAEIASGEWCSVDEIEQLINQLTEEHPGAP